jgi:hypothetical protein
MAAVRKRPAQSPRLRSIHLQRGAARRRAPYHRRRSSLPVVPVEEVQTRSAASPLASASATRLLRPPPVSFLSRRAAGEHAGEAGGAGGWGQETLFLRPGVHL